jgi:preprotein translocase subunit SecG
MAISGLIAVFVILSLFLSMLTSSPRSNSASRDESSSDTAA